MNRGPSVRFDSMGHSMLGQMQNEQSALGVVADEARGFALGPRIGGSNDGNGTLVGTGDIDTTDCSSKEELFDRLGFDKGPLRKQDVWTIASVVAASGAPIHQVVSPPNASAVLQEEYADMDAGIDGDKDPQEESSNGENQSDSHSSMSSRDSCSRSLPPPPPHALSVRRQSLVNWESASEFQPNHYGANKNGSFDEDIEDDEEEDDMVSRNEQQLMRCVALALSTREGPSSELLAECEDNLATTDDGNSRNSRQLTKRLVRILMRMRKHALKNQPSDSLYGSPSFVAFGRSPQSDGSSSSRLSSSPSMSQSTPGGSPVAPSGHRLPCVGFETLAALCNASLRASADRRDWSSPYQLLQLTGAYYQRFRRSPPPQRLPSSISAAHSGPARARSNNPEDTSLGSDHDQDKGFKCVPRQPVQRTTALTTKAEGL